MKKLIALVVTVGLVGVALAADYTPMSAEDATTVGTFATVTATGAATLPILATTVDATTARVMTAADYGQQVIAQYLDKKSRAHDVALKFLKEEIRGMF